MIRALYSHWPESHAFQPESEDHLRAWLECKAGYCSVVTIDPANMTPEQIVAAVSAAYSTGKWHFTKAVETRLHVFTPSSISFDELPHKKACILFDDVAEIAEAETDLKINDIMPPVRLRA